MVEVQLVDSSESSSPTLHNARAKENDGDLRKLLSEDAAVNKDTEGIYPLFFPFSGCHEGEQCQGCQASACETRGQAGQSQQKR